MNRLMKKFALFVKLLVGAFLRGVGPYVLLFASVFLFVYLVETFDWIMKAFNIFLIVTLVASVLFLVFIMPFVFLDKVWSEYKIKRDERGL